MFERRFFLLAPSYHGATLLAKLLHANPEIVSLGDTYPSNLYDQVCGCGRKISGCDFWESIKKRVNAQRYCCYSTILPRYPKIVSPYIDRYLTNDIYTMPVKRLIKKHNLRTFVQDYENFLRAVYSESGKTGSKIFVDGVKSIPRVIAMLEANASVHGIIHLVRAPEDYAKSFATHSERAKIGLVEASIRWRRYHTRAKRLSSTVPYIRLSYEALIDRTNAVLASLFQFMRVSVMSVDELKSYFGEEWHFMGNSTVMKFDGQLRRSRHELSRSDKAIVKAVVGHTRYLLPDSRQSIEN